MSFFGFPRPGVVASEIVYYVSKPETETFPIAILVSGSSLEDDIIFYFLIQNEYQYYADKVVYIVLLMLTMYKLFLLVVHT